MQMRKRVKETSPVAASCASTSQKGNGQGRRIAAARKATLAAIFVAVLASLAFDSGIGTPSAFGIGRFFLLCPLGGLEVMIADHSIIPIAAISMGVVLVLTLAFGRAWCAWGCPVPPLRKFFKREPSGRAKGAGSSVAATRHAPCTGIVQARGFKASFAYIGHDTRTWVFAAVLVAAFVAGFPLFCLVCPIGLTFGSVASLWHLIVDKQLTASVLVFPAALVVETVVYRKWCLNVCPVAGLLNIVGQFVPFFRPTINKNTCLRYTEGADCTVCTVACSDAIDKHAVDGVQQLGTCTRCGSCAALCPTQSITLSAKPSPPFPDDA